MTTRAIAAVLLGLAVSVTSPARAQDGVSQTRISLSDGAQLARQLLLSGEAAPARDIARALVASDPADVDALILLAQSSLRLGDTTTARDAARQAWRSARAPRQRFIAAFTMADVLAADEAYTRSQFWLRRALNTAPGPQSELVATEAFRRVRQENPLAIEVRLGASPSSNVNSGNSNEAINFAFLPGVLGELEFLVPPDQRPLSGLELSLQSDIRYRIAQTQRSRTSLEFGVYGRTYIMSESARASAPDVTGESLSYARASLGLLHQWVPPESDTRYSANLTLSHDWYGGDPYRIELDGTFGAQLTLGDASTLALSGGVKYGHTLTSDTDVWTYSARGRWTRTLQNEDRFSLNAQFATATSDASDLAYDALTLGARYDFGDIGAGFDLAGSVSEQYRVYETSVFDPAGREDRITSAGLDVGLQSIDFYGFQPVVSLLARRTASSVPRFDTEGAQLGVNLRSSF